MLLNLRHEGENLVAYLGVPGFKKEDLSISGKEIPGKDSVMITVKGRRSAKGYPTRVISKEFEIINQSIDYSKIYASLKDGILKIVLPKIAAPPAKEIKIQ